MAKETSSLFKMNICNKYTLILASNHRNKFFYKLVVILINKNKLCSARKVVFYNDTSFICSSSLCAKQYGKACPDP